MAQAFQPYWTAYRKHCVRTWLRRGWTAEQIAGVLGRKRTVINSAIWRYRLREPDPAWSDVDG